MRSREIYVDIDNTICKTSGMDYADSLRTILRLLIGYMMRVIILLIDGEGKSGIDFRELTEGQLKKWGAKYHELKMGKPAYDILIDDKAINQIKELDFFLNLIEK